MLIMTTKKIHHPKLEFKDVSYGFFTKKGGYSKFHMIRLIVVLT